jgi:hypothetical protein
MFDLQAEDVSRGAKALLTYPEGSPERATAGRKLLDEYKAKGYMNNLEHWQALKHPLDDATLNHIVTRNVSVPISAEITGEAARAQAAGTGQGGAPYKTETAGPGANIVRPAQLPGAPPVGGTVGQFGPQGGPTTGTVVRAPLGGTGTRTSVPLTPQGEDATTPMTPRTVTPTRVGPGGVPPTPSATAPAAVPPPTQPAGKNAFYDEVPRMTPSNTANPPGVAYKGKTPSEIKMEEDAAEVYNKEIRQPGMTAQQQRAGLGTIKSTLENGWNTSRVAPTLEHISGWMYAAGLAPKTIQGITGIDPSRAEIASKETIQDSMKFVKDTIGARESLMAINAVRSAFPNSMNTKEANMALVDSMDQTAKWKQDRANYAAQFLKKNADIPKNEALDEFNHWWNDTHSLESYVSKVVPWQTPMAGGKPDRSSMQKGVTYVTPRGERFIWGGN